jgi:type I restriction enzyme R subunit
VRDPENGMEYTVSRLNRIYPPLKEDTFVLNFANDAEKIQHAFQPYLRTAVLTEGIDPNKLYDLMRLLEERHYFGQSDVEAFAAVYFAPKAK